MAYFNHQNTTGIYLSTKASPLIVSQTITTRKKYIIHPDLCTTAYVNSSFLVFQVRSLKFVVSCPSTMQLRFRVLRQTLHRSVVDQLLLVLYSCTSYSNRGSWSLVVIPCWWCNKFDERSLRWRQLDGHTKVINIWTSLGMYFALVCQNTNLSQFFMPWDIFPIHLWRRMCYSIDWSVKIP